MTRSNEFIHSSQNSIEINAEPIDRGEVILRLADLAMQEELLQYATAEGDIDSMHDLAKVKKQIKLAQYTLDHSVESMAA